MADPSADQPVDALDTITVQDGIIAELLATWRHATGELQEGDDVDTRWERGSAVKLLLQHFAVRESAKNALSEALRSRGSEELAAHIEGDGAARRQAITRLEETTRGRQAMALNYPEVDEAVEALGAVFDRERPDEVERWVPAAEAELGPAGARDLPSARTVRLTSTTRPDPELRWFSRVTPVRAVRALYQHLRGTPTGGTSPAVDGGREHTPGLRP